MNQWTLKYSRGYKKDCLSVGWKGDKNSFHISFMEKVQSYIPIRLRYYSYQICAAQYSIRNNSSEVNNELGREHNP